MRKTVFQLAVLALLGTVYLLALAAVLRPRVSADYRAYFIERTSTEWHPVHYTATPAQGISFSSPGLPTFVRYVAGFSYREPWGRWTDASRAPVPQIAFAQGFDGTICVDLKAHASNAIKHKPVTVAFGDQRRTVSISAGPFADYLIEFHLSKPADVMEFMFSGTIPPENAVDRDNLDSRRLGLAMIYLRLYALSCASVEGQLAR